MFFRLQEAKHALVALGGREPRVVSFGGGAVTSPSVREALHETAFTVLLDVEPGEAWRRVGGTRPLAQDEQQFRSLYAERDPLYRATADAVVSSGDSDGLVLAAAGVHHERGALERLGELLPGDGPVALVADATVMGIHGAAAQTALGDRLVSRHELPSGEQAKQLGVVARLWSELDLDRSGHRRRARRRRADRRRGVRRVDLSARRPLGGGADDARRPGRCRDRRQDGDRPARGQEPRGRVPLAGPGRDRRAAARDAAGAGAAPGCRRARQDRAARGPHARRPRRGGVQVGALPPRSARPRAARRGSTSAIPSRTRSRRRRGSSSRTARPSRSACSPPCG